MKFTKLIAIAAIVTATPAIAKDILLPLNDQQQAGFLQVLDKATRDGGLSAANSGTVYFYNLLKQAIDTANAPPRPVDVPKAPEEEPAAK